MRVREFLSHRVKTTLALYGEITGFMLVLKMVCTQMQTGQQVKGGLWCRGWWQAVCARAGPRGHRGQSSR